MPLLTRKKKEATPLFSRGSLCQTRLNAFVQGDAEHANAVVRWRSEIRSKPQVYSFTALVERLAHLEKVIGDLEPQVQCPPDSMTPEEWLSLRGRLGRLSGQAFAIRLALDGNTCGAGSPLSSSTPALAPADWTNDPFAEE